MRKRSGQKSLKRLSIVLIFLFLVFLPYLIWLNQPAIPLSVFVLDKTVGANFQEHRSFFWLLQHYKITNPSTNEFYDDETDYYGYHPTDSLYDIPEDFHLNDVDLLYLTDAYGVYQYPMEYHQYERIIPRTYVPIAQLYGGMQEDEVNEILRYESLGKTSIAEFNVLGFPTIRKRTVKEKLEKIFGIRYDGLVGKYYDDLNDAARWMKDRYEVQAHSTWNFKGSGIIIVRDGFQDSAHTVSLVVLDRNDLRQTPMVIIKKNVPFMNEVSETVPYYYFFEILRLRDSAETLATFDLRCTESGKQKLDSAGIPLSFPAVVANSPRRQNFYFAGDFADNKVESLFLRYWGVEYVLERAYYFYIVSDQTRFFWRFYLPLMHAILTKTIERS